MRGPPHPPCRASSTRRRGEGRGKGRTVAFVLLALGPAIANACGDDLAAGKRTIQNTGYVIAYVTSPAKIAVGEHFAVDFAVCPRGRAAAPQSVRVDAGMPAHKHGMNYRAVVTRLAPGRYRAEGLLFHMSGGWELTFDVVTGNRTERLASPILLE